MAGKDLLTLSLVNILSTATSVGIALACSCWESRAEWNRPEQNYRKDSLALLQGLQREALSVSPGDPAARLNL